MRKIENKEKQKLKEKEYLGFIMTLCHADKITESDVDKLKVMCWKASMFDASNEGYYAWKIDSGELIAKCRTQQELALKLGLDQASVSLYLNNRKKSRGFKFSKGEYYCYEERKNYK